MMMFVLLSHPVRCYFLSCGIFVLENRRHWKKALFSFLLFSAISSSLLSVRRADEDYEGEVAEVMLMMDDMYIYLQVQSKKYKS